MLKEAETGSSCTRQSGNFAVNRQGNKETGARSNLIERILKDGRFNITRDEIKYLLDVNKFIGMAEKQVEKYTKKVLERFESEVICDSYEDEINV